MKLKVKGVHFSYDSINALNDVSIEVGDGEVVSMVGPNGSGKTTLLKCINKILKPKKGTILLDGRNLSDIGLKEMARLSGYVPQSANYIFPSTVFDAVLLGRRPYIDWNVSPRDKEVVSQMLAVTGLKGMVLRYFNELSGGERQKVLIARALAQEPEVLLLDEPTSNLDLRHQLEILDLITAMVREKGISAIMAVHDLNLAAKFSKKVILLKLGEIYTAGEPGTVLTRENIRSVYGVDTLVNNDSGRPHIIPIGVSAG